MTGPVRQPVYAGTSAVQTPFKGVTVVNVNKDTLMAIVRDAFGAIFQVRADIMRAKGNLPEQGEQWIVDRQYGDWVFGAILNGGVQGVVVPPENVDGLADTLADFDTRVTNIGNNTQSNQASQAAGLTALQAATTGKIAAKGDLLVGTGPGVLAKLPVGTGVLVANTSATTGLAYSNALAQVLDGTITMDQVVGGTAIRSTGDGAGIKFGTSIVQVTDGAGTTFNSIKATAFTVASSLTLKTDVENFRPAFIEGLERVEPRTYRYRDHEDGRRHLGFIAEEVATVHPRLLDGDPDGDPRELGIDSMALIAFLWGAVRELSDRVRELERSEGRGA